MRITFHYTNWRGESATRVAEPVALRLGATEWHPETQWLMLAEDVERAAEREFAVADMRAIGFDGIAAPVGRLPVTTPGSEGWADLMVVDGGYVVVPSL